jgi:rubrerythrin
MNAAMQARGASVEYEAPENFFELMAVALAMESEAAQRYAEFADAMEMANNVEVAQLFRKMANIETGHAQAIMSQMGWREPPSFHDNGWMRPLERLEAPRGDDVHYLMQPYHALEVALESEQRALDFYGRLARLTDVEAVREAAVTLEHEEREHVELIRAWMAKVEKPTDDWADDPDPPRYTD